MSIHSSIKTESSPASSQTDSRDEFIRDAATYAVGSIGDIAAKALHASWDLDSDNPEHQAAILEIRDALALISVCSQFLNPAGVKDVMNLS